MYLEENLREKENAPEVPEIGMAVLRQQFVLAETIETWIATLKSELFEALLGKKNGETLS